MHIVMAGDNRMSCGMELVIYSTMKYNRNIHWHIFTMDCEVDHKDVCQIHQYNAVSSDTLKWFDFIIRYMDNDSKLTVHDCIEPYHDYLENSVNAYTHFTPYAALRLCSDIILKDVPNCLYLDSDIIVQDDLGWMYAQYTNQDTDYAAFVTPDALEDWGEMVSGVIVFNLDRIRISGFLERARNNYNYFRYTYPDQMAMAKAADPMKLPETYDYIDDHKLAPYKPAILHFTNKNKFKIYTVTPGMFYRYYPEHLHLKQGLDTLREIYLNYQIYAHERKRNIDDVLPVKYETIKVPSHTDRQKQNKGQDSECSECQ